MKIAKEGSVVTKNQSSILQTVWHCRNSAIVATKLSLQDAIQKLELAVEEFAEVHGENADDSWLDIANVLEPHFDYLEVHNDTAAKKDGVAISLVVEIDKGSLLL